MVTENMDQKEIIHTLKKFKEDNKNKYHISRLGLFGSAAKNCMKDNSDIDVVVKIVKQDMFGLIGIKQDLEEILQRPVDVVSYREARNALLKQRIDEEALYV